MNATPNLARSALIFGLGAAAFAIAGVIITIRTVGEVLIIAAKIAWPYAMRLARYVAELRGESDIVTQEV